MTTGEQARAWAKAEAEKRYNGRFEQALPAGAVRNARREAAEWAFLHVLSLLESEQAVEAAAKALYNNPFDEASAASMIDARAALAAAVAAITVAHNGSTQPVAPYTDEALYGNTNPKEFPGV